LKCRAAKGRYGNPQTSDAIGIWIAVPDQVSRQFSFAPVKIMRCLPATVPRSNQEFWDEAVPRWPALTAETLAGVKPDAPFLD